MTTATKFKTWGETLDYCFQTRHTWRHGSGSKPAKINTNHFTRLRGRSVKLDAINPQLMTQFCIELEDEGKSDGTINRVVSAVSTVLNHAAFDGLIDKPHKFRRRKENEGRMLYFTQEEVDMMVEHAKTTFLREDLADIVKFAAYTGMRQGEILKLRCKDIDWNLHKILVGGEEAVKTKPGNFRAIPISDKIREILARRCESCKGETLIFGDEWPSKDLLLRAFKKVVRLIGKEDTYVFHCLRHSFATWHAEAGTPLRTLMTLMGHKRIETTLRYAKTTDASLVSAMAAI